MSKSGKYASKKSIKRDKRRKGLIAALCVLLALLAIAAAAAFGLLDGILNKINIVDVDWNKEADPSAPTIFTGIPDDPTETVETEAPTVAETEAPTEPETTAAPTEPDYGKTGKLTNLLIVGQDAREGENSKLADTIILCSINKETDTLTLTSFLRDSFVKLPDWKNENGYVVYECGRNRINVTYALGYQWGGTGGAMKMASECIELNFGVPVDGVVEIDFDAFTSVVKALGGVDVELNEDEAKYMTDLAMASQWKVQHRTFEVGMNHMNGREALWYARMRHSNAGDSDIKRAGRQRDLIVTLIKKCTNLSMSELNKLLDEVLPMISTNISKDDMKTYIAELLPMIFNLKMDSVQIPVEGSAHGETVDHPDIPGYVLKMDMEWNKRVIQEYALKKD